MKFFVVSDSVGAVVDCTLSIRAAHRAGRQYEPTGVYTVDRITIGTSTPTETIRRLLGNLGGYADDNTRVYPPETGPGASV